MMDEREQAEAILSQLHRAGFFLHFHMGGGRAGRCRALTVLLSCQEMPQKELQEHLAVQSGSMSELIAKLEGDGLLRKRRSGQDGRMSLLALKKQSAPKKKKKCSVNGCFPVSRRSSALCYANSCRLCWTIGGSWVRPALEGYRLGKGEGWTVLSRSAFAGVLEGRGESAVFFRKEVIANDNPTIGRKRAGI